MNRAAGLAVIALLLCAVFFLSLPGVTAWQRVLQDAGHGPVFATMAIVLLLIEARPDPVPVYASYVRAFLLAVIIGIATECVQYFQPGRNVSGFDALRDAAGAAFGLAVYALFERDAKASGRSLPLLAVTLGAFVLLVWQPVRCAIAYAERSREFPVLLRGDNASGLYFAHARNATLQRVPLPPAWRGAGDGHAVRLEFAGNTQPALELDEPAPDWRGHESLLFDITNPGPSPLEFTLRIMDARHDWTHADRFNTPIVIPPASRVGVRVSLAAVAAAPAHRTMNMSAIANVMLFSPRPLHGTEFYVSRVWLE